MSLSAVRDELKALVAGLDADVLTGTDAADAARLFAEVSRLAAAGTTLVMRRVDECGVWRGGYSSAAAWLAAQTGDRLGEAVAVVDTAARLADAPATADRLRAGELSVASARQVAVAAAADPASEARLLGVAARGDHRELRQAADRVRRQAASAFDEQLRHARIHRARYLRHHTDPDGAFRLEARLTADHGAIVLAALAPHRDEAFEQARAEGRRERSEAYAADALVALAAESLGHRVPGRQPVAVAAAGVGDRPPDPTADVVPTEGGPGRARRRPRRRPRAEIKIVVSSAALRRGWVAGDEVCEIPGVGPVPVSIARQHLDDAVLWALVHDGVDIQSVASVSRYVAPAQQAAVELRDPQCIVPGCHRRVSLENHHLVAYAEGGPTSLTNLARPCEHHHDDLTYRHAELRRVDGEWVWRPPPSPAEPRPAQRTSPVGDALPP